MDISNSNGPRRGRRFTVPASDAGRGRLFIPVPFDPDAEWGPKTRHPVGGTVNGIRVRGIVQRRNGVHGFLIGPAWLRASGLTDGQQAKVYLEPEGPQRQDLADDVAAALEASPPAAQFFDSLAQFYRRGYLRWIDATKRNPAMRQQRIARTVELLEAGIKDYRTQ